MKICENCGREPECTYKITMDYKGCKYWVSVDEFNEIVEQQERESKKDKEVNK